MGAYLSVAQWRDLLFCFWFVGTERFPTNFNQGKVKAT